MKRDSIPNLLTENQVQNKLIQRSDKLASKINDLREKLNWKIFCNADMESSTKTE